VSEGEKQKVTLLNNLADDCSCTVNMAVTAILKLTDYAGDLRD